MSWITTDACQCLKRGWSLTIAISTTRDIYWPWLSIYTIFLSHNSDLVRTDTSLDAPRSIFSSWKRLKAGQRERTYRKQSRSSKGQKYWSWAFFRSFFNLPTTIPLLSDFAWRSMLWFNFDLKLFIYTRNTSHNTCTNQSYPSYVILYDSACIFPAKTE